MEVISCKMGIFMIMIRHFQFSCLDTMQFKYFNFASLGILAPNNYVPQCGEF